MAEKNSVKTLEAGGIEFEYDEAKLDDVRVMFAIGKLSDEKVGDEDKMKWYTRLMDLLFTSPYEVMCDLADLHGGKLTVEDYNEFFFAALEGMQAKN